MSPFAADFVDLCVATVIWQPITGRDQYGKPVYGSQQMFQGRRVNKYSRVAAYERGIKGQGSEAISEAQIWILGTPAVKYEDAVYLDGDLASGQDPSVLPVVLSVQTFQDENGDAFVKVFLGSSNG